MKKVLVILLSLILITFCGCQKNGDSISFMNMIENAVGLTESEFCEKIRELSVKQTSYLTHHFGDVNFTLLMDDMPYDAASYAQEKPSFRLGGYDYTERILFVAQDAEENSPLLLTSFGYSFDTKSDNELYNAVKAFHEAFMKEYPNCVFNPEFEASLASKDEFIKFTDKCSKEKFTYTKDSIGSCVTIQGQYEGSGEFEKTDFRFVSQINSYTSEAFENKVSLSVHKFKESGAYRFNAVYQAEDLSLKLNRFDDNKTCYRIVSGRPFGKEQGKYAFALDY